MGTRHGGGPETHRHSQEEDKTQRDRIRPLGHLSHLTFAGFSPPGSVSDMYSFNKCCLESALCQAGCQDTLSEVAQLCLTLCSWTIAYWLLRPRDFLGKGTGVGCHFLLQRIFLTQGSNPGLPALQENALPSEPLKKDRTSSLEELLTQWQRQTIIE